MLGSAADLLALCRPPLLVVLSSTVAFNILGVEFFATFSTNCGRGSQQLQHRRDHITTDDPSSPPTTCPMAVPASGPARVAGVKAGSSATPQRAVGTAGAAHHLDLQEEALLNTFTEVLNVEGHLPAATHGVEHHIVTNGRPVTTKFWWLDGAKLVAAKAEFQQRQRG